MSLPTTRVCAYKFWERMKDCSRDAAAINHERESIKSVNQSFGPDAIQIRMHIVHDHTGAAAALSESQAFHHSDVGKSCQVLKKRNCVGCGAYEHKSDRKSVV